MQYNNPHQKAGGHQQRPGSSLGNRQGYNDWKWSEDKAKQHIEQKLGSGCVDEILSDNKTNYNDYIERVKAYVASNVKGITTAQLRNIFSKVKNIDSYTTLYLLRPKLAYVSGRAERDEMKTLLFLLDTLISKVSDNDKLEQFKAFFESVIAYHKYFGGKE